jgi:hypothetical protein
VDSLEYLIDIGNSAIFNTPIKFTSRYIGLEHYQKVLDDQHRLMILMGKMIRMEAEEQ